MNQRPAGAVRFYGDIQWLRGLAAFLVVLEHLKNEVMFRLQGFDPESFPMVFFPFAAGVDIFFVISGFVIAHASRDLFQCRGAARVFLARRIVRIVPLYWLITSVFLLLFLVTGNRQVAGFDPAFLLGSYLFVPVANVDGVPLPIMILGWTLNYEMMFYGIFALVLGLPRRLGLIAVALILVAIVLLGQMLQPTSLQLVFWSDPIVLEFLAGIAIQRFCARGLVLSDGVRILLAGAGFVLLFWIGLPEDLRAHRWILWGGPAALIVLAAAAGADHRDGRWGRLAGDTSYAVYLVHLLVLVCLSRLFIAVGLTDAWLVYLLYPPLALGSIAAAALVLHLSFERPILLRSRQYIDR